MTCRPHVGEWFLCPLQTFDSVGITLCGCFAEQLDSEVGVPLQGARHTVYVQAAELDLRVRAADVSGATICRRNGVTAPR